MLRAVPLVDQVAIKAIECTVRKAVRRGWFEACEIEDLSQEIVVRLLKRLDRFDPTRATWSTFCTLVARNFLSKERRRRRRNTTAVESLDARRADKSRLVDSVENGQSPGRRFARRRPATEHSDLYQDVHEQVEALPEPLRELCRVYLKYPSLPEAAQQLGVSRHTFYRQRKQVRNAFSDDHLHEYR